MNEPVTTVHTFAAHLLEVSAQVVLPVAIIITSGVAVSGPA